MALNASVDAYNADTSKGVTVITVPAAAARDAEQVAAKRLDDASVIWPAGFDEDVTTLRDTYYEDVVTAGQIASAKSIADVNAVTPGPDQAKGAEASARMRARLNLPADTQSSCKGY